MVMIHYTDPQGNAQTDGYYLAGEATDIAAELKKTGCTNIRLVPKAELASQDAP